MLLTKQFQNLRLIRRISMIVVTATTKTMLDNPLWIRVFICFKVVRVLRDSSCEVISFFICEFLGVIG